MVNTKNIVIQGKHNRPILLDLYTPDHLKKDCVVIFCHGYKGFKDWGAWELVAKSFTEHGYPFIKFNFSHNGGTVEEPMDFPDPEAFGHNNYTKELDDLQSVINWIKDKSMIASGHIVLIGHSRGGGIVSIKASEDPNIKAIISWGGVSDLKSKFTDQRTLDFWKMMSVIYTENSRTKQKLPHYYQFYEDFLENEDRLTLKKAVAKITIPHLIIHGSADTTVLPEEANDLKTWNTKAELKIINNANHVFGASHPWAKNSLPPHLNEVVQSTISFIKKEEALF